MLNSTQITISPQGQITIPKSWRRILGIDKGSKMIVELHKSPKGTAMTLSTLPKKWSTIVAGSGEGLWSESDDYLEKERDSWK